jgi:asparagine synthase (glutamine-hydrolysing)
MKRRGPDGIGFWTDGVVSMAQTRLSIVGLDDRSLAPLENASHVLCFNGEILNFLEVARQLGVPAINDTHVLLEAWTVLGLEVLRMLEGFWSFAVYSKAEKTVTLCRDQMGIKPLYYAPRAFGAGGLVASSTLAPLLSCLDVKPSLDFEVMSEWARWQITTGGRTFHKGVLKIWPGQTVEYDAKTLQQGARKTYEAMWDVHGEAKATDEWILDARAMLRRCVDDEATGDVAVTSTCSGGLDSSLVTRILAPEVAYHGNFSLGECNETKWATAAVEGTDTRLLVTNCQEDFDLVSRLDSLIEDVDELTVGSVILPLDDVFGQVKRRFKVCLLGTGGDELFGGYARYGLSLGEAPTQESYRAAFGKLHGTPWQRFEQSHVKGDPSLFKFYPDHEPTFPAIEGARTDLEAMLTFDRKHFLGGLLTLDDRMAGRHGIEGRPALLHQRFVRRVLELDPAEMKGKSVLRRIARGILPDAVVDRQDKCGFTVPLGPMINTNADRIREKLSASRFRDLFNLRRVTFTAESLYDRRVFGLVQLNAWLERYA